jgi:DNA (cytosine-5)-methyltransferase 1
MLLIDFYCGGGGGASMGYHRAGFDVVGVDKYPQPNYPFPFIQGDAIDVLTRMLAGEKFRASNGIEYGIDDVDVWHASPPCQRYSKITKLAGVPGDHPDLLQPTLDLLIASGKPYIVENVPGSPMTNYLMLCGTMFGLRVFRHRLFMCNPMILISPASCNHYGKSCNGGKNGDQKHPDGEFITVTGSVHPIAKAKKAMGIDWMRREELVEAIPPAYTEWIGGQLISMFAGVQ